MFRSFNMVFSLAAMIGALASAAAAQEAREYVNPRTASDTDVLPFSGAVWVGNTLYLSGTIGLDENQQVPDTPEEEARLVMESVRSTVEAAGLTMDDLVTVQVFCSDVSHYAAFNSVYRTYFTGEFPARAFIGVGTLLFDARFEVQGIAARQ
jgi:reactive intermediate/imine deaminase